MFSLVGSRKKSVRAGNALHYNFGRKGPDTDNNAVGEILEPRYVCVTSSSAERVGRDLC